MIKSSNFKKAIELIDSAQKVLLTSHTRPDGDGCGTVAALERCLKRQGKEVKSVFLSEVPEWYWFLFSEQPVVVGKDVSVEELASGEVIEPDLIIIVDTNSYSQLSKLEGYLKSNDKPVLVIDHHVTGEGLGDVELVDTSAAAAGLIAYELLKSAGWQIDEQMAEAFFMTIVSDTGWFKLDNADSRAHRSCSELIELGVNSAKLYRQLYQNFSHERFRLMVAMLKNLKLELDGRYASQYLRQSDFKEAGASFSDTENLIEECRRIGSVEVATLFVELVDGRVKCSLRSKGGVDVSEIAGKHGGGGHKMASGTHLDGPLEKAMEIILSEVKGRMKL